MKIYYISLLILLFNFKVNAQQYRKTNLSTDTIKSLTVGDRLPDVFIPKIINNNTSKMEISEYSDQLLILDFWATTCPGCIEKLPYMAELQKKFSGKIKILPVTYEEEGKASAFLKKNRLTKNLNLPSIVEDKILTKLFKHILIPHEIWIYKGYVIAITDAEYVNEQNIELILSGKLNEWQIKNDFLATMKAGTPVLQPNVSLQSSEKNKINYACILGNVESSKSIIGNSIDSISHMRRSYIINFSILDAYTMTWRLLKPNLSLPEPNQIIWEVKNPSKYAYNPKLTYRAEFRKNYNISYESYKLDTINDSERQAKAIISDLDYLLNLKGRWEKRKVKSLILVKMENGKRFKSTKGEQYVVLDKPLKELHNSPLNTITWLINQEAENPRTFNETGFDGILNIDLNIGAWTDIQNIRKELNKYGLDLKDEEREQEMFVLTEPTR